MAGILGELDVLAACERAASDRNDAPGAAFVTWLVGQRQGWPAARQRVSRTVWYQHLRLLRRAGVDVPGRRARAGNGVREMHSGGALLRMVGMRFRLLSAFDQWTAPGTCGAVVQVLFRNAQWLVGVQFDGSPGSYEEIRIGRFAQLVEWIPVDV